MADGQGGGIKGIAIAVTADASQIKRVFNEAVEGFEHKTIEITLEAIEGKSFEKIFGALRNQNIEIGVTLKPNRQTIRDFRRDFNDRLAREGGALVPIKPKVLTQREGKEIRGAISNAIGTPVVKVLLEWQWKDGPPPTEFTGAVRGGPPGGGGGGGTEAWGPFRPPPTQPVSQSAVNTFIRQEVARRMAVQGTSGAPTGAPAAPVSEPARTMTAVGATRAARTKEPKKANRFAQQPGESEEEWTARLLERHAAATKKLTSSSEKVRVRANNAIVEIEKRLGMDASRERQVVSGKTQTRVGPKRVEIAEANPTVRPERTAEGKLLSDAISDAIQQGRREGTITGPTPGTLSARRAEAQKEMGVKVGAFGVEDLGQLASLASGAAAQNALIERINERLFGGFVPEQRTGFRGGGRATRSVFSGQEAVMEFVGTPGPSERINAPKQRQIVEAGEAIGAFLDEIEGGLRRDFRGDAEAMSTFRERWTAPVTPSETYAPEGSPERAALERRISNRRFGASFAQAEEFRRKGNLARAVFGDRRYNEETGSFDLVPEGEELPSGEVSTGFEGALYARANLDALARNRKLPGVGPGAVRYAQAETRDDMPKGITEAGLNYISTRDALSAIVSEFRAVSAEAVKTAATKAAGEQAAATTAEALKPPTRPIVPGRGQIPAPGLLAPDSPLQLVGGTPPPLAPTGRRTGRSDSVRVGGPAFVANESREAYQARRAEAMETYNASLEKFNKRVERLMPGLNDPSRMQYPTFPTAPRQGATFSPFRPKSGEEGVRYVDPQSFVDIDREVTPSSIPDLSDLGYSREQVMAALSEPAMAAGGVTPPPIPPGTVLGGAGGGNDWRGGVVPVRVENWPESLQGQGTFAAGQTAMPPSDDMLRMFQTATSQGFEEAMDKLGWKPRQEAEPEPKEPKNPADEFERAGTARSLRSVLSNSARLGLGQPSPEELRDIERQAQTLSGVNLGGVDVGRTAEALDQAQEWARVAVEASPARAVATATGQIFSNLPFIGGRSGILQRQREALGATSEARSIQNQLVDQRAALAVMEEQLKLLPEGSVRHKNQTKDINEQRKAVEATGLAYDDAAKKATKLNREVAGVADVARSFAAGVVGTITGQILFQGVFGAAQAIVGGLAQGLGPVVERMTGYKNVVAATTGELAAQTTQTGQLTEALVEQRLAAANMTKTAGDRIDSLLTERAELMAGNKQIEEQTKLYASAADIQQANVRGLGPRGSGRYRYGSDINLYESTGGLWNTSFFAPQQSTQEALGNLFREAGRQQQEAAAAAAAAAMRGSGAEGESFGRGIWARNTDFERAGPTRSRQLALDERTAAAAARRPLPDAVKEFDEALKAANNSLELHIAATDADRDKVEQFADALDAADMQEFASAVRKEGFYVEGLGQITEQQRPRVVTQAVENYARGVARRDPGQLIEGMADQIKAVIQGQAEQARIQRELIIPSQRGLSNLANPIVPLSQVELLGAPAGGGGMFSDLLGAAGGREGLAPSAQAAYRRAAQSTVVAQQRRAVMEQREMGAIDELFARLGDSTKNEYLEVRSQIKDIGQELADLQNRQVTIQVRLQTAQFDEQLRQVRRSLADARERASGVDATGNEGAGPNVGLLERQGIMLSRSAAAVGFQQQQLGLQSQALQLQNQLLGRRSQMLQFQSTELGFQSKQLSFQSQALSLAQNQRQINFQQALAGITAPGMTPEERAARIREAELEADVAQKQQDIAVSQFGIQQQQFGLEQQQFGISQAQFALDGQQLAIQQQAYVLAQQQYGLSVAQFNNQQAILDAQNARAVEDLSIQERLVEAAKAAQQELALNEKTIDNLRSALEAEMQMAGSYLEQASGVATTIASVSTSLVAQFGGDLQKMVEAYARAWGSFRDRVTMTDSQWYSQNPETRYGGGRLGKSNAPGELGMVSMPTQMVVGDAGGEMVAILRNPKPVATGVSGMSGGGVQIFAPITITGNQIRADDDQEIERLASRLTRLIEQRLGTRASMFGFAGVGR